MPIKQDSRSLAIKTPLGADVLGLRSMAVHEQLSRLFQIEAELNSEDGSIDLDKVVGHDVTIRLNVGQKDKRYFHGYVSRMVQMANQGAYAHYRATIVPWLWFLTRTSDCRIFQQKSTPDIIEEVFKGNGFSDYQLKLSGSYQPKEYCVQYRETDFNFVSRLMEQEGIYYFFDHQDGKHTLVLVDAASAHKPFPGYTEVTFHEAEHGTAIREVITEWTMEKEVQPVATALQDFDFKKPKTSLLASTNVSRKYGEAKYEIYDYPGEYIDHGDGERLVDVRLEEFQTQYETLHGQGSSRGLAPGSTFKLKNHPRNDQDREYLVTGISLHADAGEFGSTGEGAGGAEFFSCSFNCIDKAQQFRPARVTPKPFVQGPQTAIVVGPAGEEIYTDEHARVKVHFHWDRHDKSDQDSSCWVRVSQYWAGKTWGAIHIPRIGQEVIIEFLEGDPDRPIITGRVYNADQTPPYGLPANKTQSGVKSRSSKGGSSANFNEIRFEDKKGSEMLTVHAEKDQTIEVEHDETHSVGHDRSKTVDHDETNHIKHDRTENVDHDEKITIGNDRTETVKGNETITIVKNKVETVEKFLSLTVNMAKNEFVHLGSSEEVGLGRNLTIGALYMIEVGGAMIVTVGGAAIEKVLRNKTVKVTKKLNIDAGQQIVLKSGDSSITLEKNGNITIAGKNITIKADATLALEGQDINAKGKASIGMDAPVATIN